jgi:hypothetical protein
MKKLMARICFRRDDAELGIAALHNAGYSILSKVFDDEPNHTFVEAYTDSESAELLLTKTYELVEPFKGSVDDAGPVPPGHVPFEYETQVWKAVE